MKNKRLHHLWSFTVNYKSIGIVFKCYYSIILEILLFLLTINNRLLLIVKNMFKNDWIKYKINENLINWVSIEMRWRNVLRTSALLKRINECFFPFFFLLISLSFALLLLYLARLVMDSETERQTTAFLLCTKSCNAETNAVGTRSAGSIERFLCIPSV